MADSDQDTTRSESQDDVRTVWEENRLHWLVDVALDDALHNRRPAVPINEVLAEWAQQHPVNRGPVWTCAMEAAIRIANIVTAFEVAGAATGDDYPCTIDECVAEHAWYTLLNYEWSDLHGNHALADTVGLLYAATWFAGSWFGTLLAVVGRTLFLYEARHQLRDDGAPREGSTSYHVLIAELAVHAVELLQDLGRPAPQVLRARLTAMARVLNAIRSPQDGVLRMGDSDDGRLLRLARDSGADVACIIDAVGIVAGLGESSATRSTRGERSLRFGGTGRQFPVDSLANQQDHMPTILVFDGFVAARMAPFVVVSRAGGETLHGRGHAHADLLSVVVELDGNPLIVDPGNNVYGAPPQVRRADIASAFHNGLCVDGGYETTVGKIASVREIVGAVSVLAAGLDAIEFIATHDGYRPFGLKVCRRVAINRGQLLLVDQMSAAVGPSTHELEILFCLAPDLRAVVDPQGVRVFRRTDEIAKFQFRMPAEMSLRVIPRTVHPRYGLSCLSDAIALAGRTGDGGLVIETRITST